MPATSTFSQLHNFHAQHLDVVKEPALPAENFQQGGNVNFPSKAEHFDHRYSSNWNGIHD